MNRAYILLLLVLIISKTAMSQVISPTGIYYLEGVMETSSGYKLNEDSTFEFFFSQGALDRTGDGRWEQSGNILTLNSPGIPSPGFILQKSERLKSSNTTVVVNESNTMLLSFIYVRPVLKNETEFMKLDSNGKLEIESEDFSEIELFFEICPERTYKFKPKHQGDNYFEFTIDPKIMNVYFDNLVMQLKGDTLNGKHPLLKGENFEFVKSR